MRGYAIDCFGKMIYVVTDLVYLEHMMKLKIFYVRKIYLAEIIQTWSQYDTTVCNYLEMLYGSYS
jgi:hypothetical protein